MVPMIPFINRIPDNAEDLKEPRVEIGDNEDLLYVAEFDSNNMELLIRNVKEGENKREGKLTITLAIFHGIIREILKYVEAGTATMNLINFVSAMTEYVETTEEKITPKKLLWFFLYNLKVNKKYFIDKNPPEFVGSDRGEAVGKFQWNNDS